MLDPSLGAEAPPLGAEADGVPPAVPPPALTAQSNAAIEPPVDRRRIARPPLTTSMASLGRGLPPVLRTNHVGGAPEHRPLPSASETTGLNALPRLGSAVMASTGTVVSTPRSGVLTGLMRIASLHHMHGGPHVATPDGGSVMSGQTRHSDASRHSHISTVGTGRAVPRSRHQCVYRDNPAFDSNAGSLAAAVLQRPVSRLPSVAGSTGSHGGPFDAGCGILAGSVFGATLAGASRRNTLAQSASKTSMLASRQASRLLHSGRRRTSSALDPSAQMAVAPPADATVIEVAPPMPGIREEDAPLAQEESHADGFAWQSPWELPDEGGNAHALHLQQAIHDDVVETIKRQDFLIRLCKAFWMYGCPSYRLAYYMHANAEALDIEANFAFFPAMILISFGDAEMHTSETHIIKCVQGYDLDRLQDASKLAVEVCRHFVTAKARRTGSNSTLIEAFLDSELFTADIRSHRDDNVVSGGADDAADPAEDSHGETPEETTPKSPQKDDQEIPWSIDQALDQLEELRHRPSCYSQQVQLVQLVLTGVFLSLNGYGGSWQAMLIALGEGIIVAGLVLAASRYEEYANLLEVSASIVIGFVAQVSATYLDTVCFWTLALSGIVNLLPGLGIVLSVTELSARNIVIGTTRLIYSLLLCAMLGYGLTIGRRLVAWEPHFPPENAATCQQLPQYAQWLFYPGVVLCFAASLRTRPVHLPGTVVIGCVSYAITMVVATYVDNRGIGIALGAMAIGVLAHLYAKYTHTVALMVALPPLLYLVPGSLALRGVTAILSNDGGDALVFAFNVLETAVAIVSGLFVANMIVMPLKSPQSISL